MLVIPDVSCEFSFEFCLQEFEKGHLVGGSWKYFEIFLLINASGFMNKESTNNYLFISSDDSNHDIIQLCLDCVKAGCCVLLLTQSPLKLAAITKGKLLKDSLQRFVIVHFVNLTELIEKLLQLHDWNQEPAMVVVDLRCHIESYRATPMDAANDSGTLHCRPPLLKQLCHCIATLYNYLDAVNSQRPDACGGASLVVLKQRADFELTAAQIDLLINLYYFKNNAFDQFDELYSQVIASFTQSNRGSRTVED